GFSVASIAANREPRSSSAMACLQPVGQCLTLGSLEIAVRVTALDGLPNQVRRRPEDHALLDRCRRGDGRYLLPPADLPGVEVLVVDDVALTTRPTETAMLADREMDAVGVDVTDAVTVEGSLVRQRRLGHARPQHREG